MYTLRHVYGRMYHVISAKGFLRGLWVFVQIEAFLLWQHLRPLWYRLTGRQAEWERQEAELRAEFGGESEYACRSEYGG